MGTPLEGDGSLYEDPLSPNPSEYEYPIAQPKLPEWLLDQLLPYTQISSTELVKGGPSWEE